MKTTNSWVTRVVLNERPIIALWMGMASHPIHLLKFDADIVIQIKKLNIKHKKSIKFTVT